MSADIDVWKKIETLPQKMIISTTCQLSEAYGFGEGDSSLFIEYLIIFFNLSITYTLSTA